jgi:hypothetical protein
MTSVCVACFSPALRHGVQGALLSFVCSRCTCNAERKVLDRALSIDTVDGKVSNGCVFTAQNDAKLQDRKAMDRYLC